jgi:LacI family transcriptional regulator
VLRILVLIIAYPLGWIVNVTKVSKTSAGTLLRDRQRCQDGASFATLSIISKPRPLPLSARRPTLRDVADLAQASFKTVSRVVNGEGGVSPDLTARVEAAVLELGYQPDERARRLRSTSERTGVIGFALVDVSNSFFSYILRGIEEVARKHNYFVLSGSTDGELERQHELVSAFVARRVDGLIVVPTGEDLGPLQHEIDRGTPLVFVDLEPDVGGVDVVRTDHLQAAFTATKHLLARGHRDIAFFGSPFDVSSARLRCQGFREAMASEGLQIPDFRVTSGWHTPQEWERIITDYFKESPRPTALFTAQNFITTGAIQALHALGLRDVVAHIGFDDVELGSVVTPGVSVVPQDPLALGRSAAELLFRRLESRLDQEPTEAVRHIVSLEVMARGSGEIPLVR